MPFPIPLKSLSDLLTEWSYPPIRFFTHINLIIDIFSLFSYYMNTISETVYFL